MKSPRAPSSNGTEPRIGKLENQCCGDKNEHHLDVADEDIGHNLGEHNLDRPHRHCEQIFHRAALALASDRERRHEDRRENQNNADQSRHDVEHRQSLGIVAGVNHELERRRRGLRPGGSAAGPG